MVTLDNLQPARNGSLANTLRKSFAVLGGVTAARLMGAGLGLVVQLLLARLLAPDAFGHVMLGMSIGNLSSIVLSGGFAALGATQLARYHSLGRRRLVQAFFAVALRDFLTLVIIGSAVTAVALAILRPGETMTLVILTGLAAALPHTVIRLNNQSANALRRFSLSMVPDFVLRPASFCAAVLALALLTDPLSEFLVLVVFALSNLAVSAGQTWALGSESTLSGVAGRPRTGMASILRVRALPLALITLISITYTDVVTAVAAVYLAPAQVASVGLSAKLAALAGFVAQAQQTIVLRDLTNAMVSGSQQNLRQVLWKTNMIATGLMLAAVAGAMLLGGWALSIFGEAYAEGKWLLVLLITAQLLRAAGGMNLHVLSLKGKQRPMALFAVLSLAVLAGAAAVLTPLWGPPGFVAAVVLADAFWIVSLGVLARRLLGHGADILAVRSA